MRSAPPAPVSPPPSAATEHATPPPSRRRAEHLLFHVLLATGLTLRIAVMLGYDTAELFWYDSFSYLDTALRLRPPGAFHPVGYSVLLRLLAPFESVLLVAAVQHLMGLAVATLLYAVARRAGLPGWGASLAAAPVLLDPAFLRVEHAVLSETLLILLITAAVAALTWRPGPKPGWRSGPAWRSASAWRPGPVNAALAGGLIAAAGLVRTAAVPLLGIFALHLLLRRTGWRPLTALLLAGGLPLLGYAAWFHQHHGRFALSRADGVSLWARTMTFADCARLRPGPELARLCPNGTTVDAASEYVWAPGASLNRLGGDRFQHNELARRFALTAITGQPLDYLRAVARDAALPWALTPVRHPARVPTLTDLPVGSWRLPVELPLVAEVRARYDSSISGLASVEPWSKVFRAWAYPYLLHGPLFLVLLAVGLRRPNLPWAVALFLYLGPIAAMDFDHRYMLPAVPFAFLGGALALAHTAASARTVRRHAPKRPVGEDQTER